MKIQEYIAVVVSAVAIANGIANALSQEMKPVYAMTSKMLAQPDERGQR